MGSPIPQTDPWGRAPLWAMASPRAESFEFKPTPIEKVDGDLWDTVLLDDDDHTYDYVIGMLHAIFGYPHIRCYLLTREVDTTGRVIVFRGSKKDAEWGRDAINSYGRDPLLERSKGSMTAIVEPADITK